MDIDRAIEVFGLARHHGCRSWCWDAQAHRVMPAAWNGRSCEPAPAFTSFEARVIAAELARIGAAGRVTLESRP